MERKLNVLFLASWYPSRVKPTSGNFIQNHAKAVALYARVSVVFVVADSSVYKTEIVVKEGDIREIIGYIPKAKGWRHILNFVNAYRAVIKQFIKLSGKPDVMHLNVIFPAGILAFILHKWWHVPYLITEHWSIYQPENRHNLTGWKRKTAQLVARHASTICPVSQNLANAMKTCGLRNENYTVLPNVINTSVFKLAAKQPNSIKRILHVSTLDEAPKNVSGMLKVIELLCHLRRDFRLDIISDGNAQRWIDWCESKGLLNRMVFFQGLKKPEEVAQFMQKSDIFLMFSNYEGLPCVILESFACGLPVAATSVGGIPEVVNSNRGILVSKGNEMAMCSALNAMLNNLIVYDRENLNSFAHNNFSNERVGKAYIDLYKMAIAHSHSEIRN